MKINFPGCFFQHNKLKEIYYKSYIVKNSQEKFRPDFQHKFPIIETAEEILMLDIKWGASRKTIMRVLGDPRFANKPLADPAKEILFFKHQIAGEKAIIQCHFIKDQFYYAHLDFVGSLSRKNKNVQEMVRQKYGVTEMANAGSVVIADAGCNKLIIEENVYLQLHYITGKAALVRKINESGMGLEVKQRDKLVLSHSMHPGNRI